MTFAFIYIMTGILTAIVITQIPDVEMSLDGFIITVLFYPIVLTIVVLGILYHLITGREIK